MKGNRAEMEHGCLAIDRQRAPSCTAFRNAAIADDFVRAAWSAAGADGGGRGGSGSNNRWLVRLAWHGSAAVGHPAAVGCGDSMRVAGDNRQARGRGQGDAWTSWMRKTGEKQFARVLLLQVYNLNLHG